MKERIGDALRNAAMRFGSALELWHKGELHAAEDQGESSQTQQSSAAGNAPAGMLAELKLAAESGTDVLIAAYNRLKTKTGFAALWKSDGAALKAAAARNDHDPEGSADATPPDEPDNVDAAGTYQGEPA